MVAARAAHPLLDEVVLGAFLHDIGKLGQRALTEKDLPDYLRNNETELLPNVGGRYGYRHVLFTDFFFEEIKKTHRQVRLPDALKIENIRDAAVYHHKPDDGRPWTWLVAEADRLASGMERKARDADDELKGASGPSAYRTTPLLAIQSRIQIAAKRTSAPALHSDAPATGAPWTYAPGELSPDALFPTSQPSAQAMNESYLQLWQSFQNGFQKLCKAHTVDHFHQGLLALSERLLWAVPSSTKDEPDVSLHDHAHAVAAIAACLYHFHAAAGSLANLAEAKSHYVSR